MLNNVKNEAKKLTNLTNYSITSFKTIKKTFNNQHFKEFY
jgi:hypothetical protein